MIGDANGGLANKWLKLRSRRAVFTVSCNEKVRNLTGIFRRGSCVRAASFNEPLFADTCRPDLSVEGMEKRPLSEYGPPSLQLIFATCGKIT